MACGTVFAREDLGATCAGALTSNLPQILTIPSTIGTTARGSTARWRYCRSGLNVPTFELEPAIAHPDSPAGPSRTRRGECSHPLARWVMPRSILTWWRRTVILPAG